MHKDRAFTCDQSMRMALAGGGDGGVCRQGRRWHVRLSHIARGPEGVGDAPPPRPTAPLPATTSHTVSPNQSTLPPVRVSFDEFCKVVVGPKPTATPTVEEAALSTDDAPTPAPAQEKPAQEAPAQEKPAAALVPGTKPPADRSTTASIARAKQAPVTTPRGYA